MLLNQCFVEQEKRKIIERMNIKLREMKFSIEKEFSQCHSNNGFYNLLMKIHQ